MGKNGKCILLGDGDYCVFSRLTSYFCSVSGSILLYSQPIRGCPPSFIVQRICARCSLCVVPFAFSSNWAIYCSDCWKCITLQTVRRADEENVGECYAIGKNNSLFLCSFLGGKIKRFIPCFRKLRSIA